METVEENKDDDNDNDPEDLDEYMDSRYGKCSGWYSLWECKKPGSYQSFDRDAHVFATAGVSNMNEDGKSLATAQMSMKKGLAMFGDQGVTAVRTEL